MPPKRSRKKRSTQLFRKSYGVGKQLLNSQTGNKREKRKEKKSVCGCYGRGTIPVTPQMIRWAVKELHKKRVCVSSSLIGRHLQRCYPVENDPAALKQELEDKLDVAVCVGLIAKCGADAYWLPTLRQQANTQKTNFTAFWKRYNKRAPRDTRRNLENTRKRLRKPLKPGLTDYTDDNDQEPDIL